MSLFPSKRQKELDQLSALNADNHQLREQLQEAHKRISMTNTRCAQIEQYLGMRDHTKKFPQGECMWDFQQVMRDLRLSQRPKSLFERGVHRKRQTKVA